MMWWVFYNHQYENALQLVTHPVIVQQAGKQICDGSHQQSGLSGWEHTIEPQLGVQSPVAAVAAASRAPPPVPAAL